MGLKEGWQGDPFPEGGIGQGSWFRGSPSNPEHCTLSRLRFSLGSKAGKGVRGGWGHRSQVSSYLGRGAVCEFHITLTRHDIFLDVIQPM